MDYIVRKKKYFIDWENDGREEFADLEDALTATMQYIAKTDPSFLLAHPVNGVRRLAEKMFRAEQKCNELCK